MLPLNINDIEYHVTAIHDAAGSLKDNGKLILATYGEDPDTGVRITPIVKHFAIGDTGEMVKAIIQLSDDIHRNIYIPLVAMRPDLESGKKGGEDDIIAVLGLCADFDDNNAHNWRDRLPLPPDYVLETSSGRYQAFYIFDRPIELGSAKAVATALKNFASCDHGTADISHVWRVAGTRNWPNTKKVKEGRSREPQLVQIINER